MGKNRGERAQLVNVAPMCTGLIDFVPCGEFVLAELVTMDRTEHGVIIPEAFQESGLSRWRCTDVGPDVKRVVVGDEFIVGNTVDSAKNGGVMYPVEGRTLKTRLVHQSIIIAIVRMPDPGAVLSDPRSRPSLLEP